MATVQTTKTQFGQRFITADGSAGVIAVAPVQREDQYTKAIHQQRQQFFQSVTKDPIILNHVLSNTATSTVNPVLSTGTIQIQETEPKIHQQMKPPTDKMWLLVEWDAPAGEPNTYSVIDSSDLMLHSQSGNSKETIHTGKTIYVRRGKNVMQATVVIISDDKQFIDTEAKQLRKMASENHYRKMAQSQEQYKEVPNLEHQTKRRRVDVMADLDEQEPVSPEYEPMPTQSQIATANWINNCKAERIISPSPSVVSVHVTNPASLPKPPPMTFDQQTQTDTRFFPQDGNQSNQQELNKIVSLLETILAEQKNTRAETEFNRKLTYDMMEQQSIFADSLKQIVAKMDCVNKYEITEVMKNPEENVSSYVVLGTGGDESRDRVSSVAESVSQKPIMNNDNTQMVSDQISVQEESNMSFCQSKFSIHDESSVNSVTSTPKNLNFINKLSSSALSLSNISIQSQVSSAPTNNNNNNSNKGSSINEMLKEWNDDESGDDSEFTSIGPNNTLVKKQVLRAINWTNYKAATRKLLMTLFSREVLASHTLTGRPSPAFMGDRAKPVKDKLDQKIIADIIAIVSSTCNVTEPMVRTAITTKCADENKMNRLKHNKGATQPAIMHFVQETGSVCDATGSQQEELNQSRKIKRENKENVH